MYLICVVGRSPCLGCLLYPVLLISLVGVLHETQHFDTPSTGTMAAVLLFVRGCRLRVPIL